MSKRGRRSFLSYAAAADGERDTAGRDPGPEQPARTAALHLASMARETTGWSWGSMCPPLRTVTWLKPPPSRQ